MTVKKLIPLGDPARVAAALEEAQARAAVRRLDADDLAGAVDLAEARLSAAGVPKHRWAGVTVRVDPHAVPGSYGGRAESTQAVLRRRSRDWALEDVGRGACAVRSYGVGRDLATVVSLPVTAVEAGTELLVSMLRKNGVSLVEKPAPLPPR